MILNQPDKYRKPHCFLQGKSVKGRFFTVNGKKMRRSNQLRRFSDRLDVSLSEPGHHTFTKPNQSRIP